MDFMEMDIMNQPTEDENALPASEGETPEVNLEAAEDTEHEQAEAKEKEAPKRKRKKKDEPEQTEPENSQPVEAPPEIPEPEAVTELLQGDDDEPAGLEPGDTDTPAAQEPVAPRRNTSSVLDAQGRVMARQRNKGMEALNYLSAAKNTKMILTGTVAGIEGTGEKLRVVFYVGPVKVLIPFSQMGFDLNANEVDASDAMRAVNQILGAKIDYMIMKVDESNRLAAASRRAAMLLRQESILNAYRSNGEFRIQEGQDCMARIVRVSQYQILVEVYGYQTFIRRDSLSHLWVSDAREVVEVGDERPVRIVELDRDDSGRVVHMAVSMKAAEGAPEIELQVGNAYTATVSGFSDSAYFVRIVGVPIEVRCPVASNFVYETMDAGDTVKIKLHHINEEFHTGSIRRILKRAEQYLL